MNDEEHRAIDILGDLTLNLDFHDDEVKEAIKVVLKRLIILDKALAAARDEALREINQPEIDDFLKGATREAAHQRERWGEEHDEEKSHEDWYWLFGYLAGKALASVKANDLDKAAHHAITAAAALAHWHAKITKDRALKSPAHKEGGGR